MTGPAVYAAVLLAAAAALLAVGPRGRIPAQPGRPESATATAGLAPGVAPGIAPGIALGAAGVVGVVVALDGTALVLGLIVLASACDVVRRLRAGRARRAIDRRRALVLTACEGLAADIRAGVAPNDALLAAGHRWPALESVARSARLGADVPEALRRLGDRPGAEQVTVLAAAWAVAHRTGAPMAGTLDLAASALRDEHAVAEVVATEIAAARATATVLALLPIGVLVLGQGIGGDSVGFLTTTSAGLFCLATGLAAAHLGLFWLDAITEGARP